MEWDADQLRVIEAPISTRLLVNAGPGAGKTDVACARVAHLIDMGVPPSRVLFLSFTRAAVSEIRDRIQRHSTKGANARITAARVMTLDSFAWKIHNHSGQGALTGSFTDNIEAAISALRSGNEDLDDYMAGWQMVVFDEAQDLIGERSMLAQEIITCLAPDAGVLILADPAQRIYGEWAVDEDSEWADEEGLDSIAADGCLDFPGMPAFETVELRGLYRTDVNPLVRIVRRLRPIALDAESEPTAAYEQIREAIVREGDALPSSALRLAEQMAAGSGNRVTSTMILFRTRGEAVVLASYLAQHNVAFRLRLPNLPVVVKPWIGRLLWGYDRSRLRRAEFDQLWAARIEDSGFDTGDSEAAWHVLDLVAGDGTGRSVDLDQLREVISRENPPDELCGRDVGSGTHLVSTIVGTIHGSKGREADEVLVCLSNRKDRDPDKLEARVLYVGATRARRRLSVGELNGTGKLGYLSSRRAWRYGRNDGSQQVEFGLQGDVDPVSPVSKLAIGNDVEISILQDAFANPNALKRLNPVFWETSASHGYARLLHCGDDGLVVGSCGERLKNDLFKAVEKLDGRWLPPDKQRYLRIMDFTTVSRPLDHPDLNRVGAPAAAGGFWVCPIIQGFSLVYAKKRWN